MNFQAILDIDEEKGQLKNSFEGVMYLRRKMTGKEREER